MKFTRLEIPDVILCEPKVFSDNRGYFTEVFKKNDLEKFLNQKIDFCQHNESLSSYGVLRGLHYQLAPYAQTKLVRVTKGSITDFAVDIRKGSPTFGKYVSCELSFENKKQLLVPRGFAHGFLVTSSEAVISYKLDNYYHPEFDRGIAYNDPSLAIHWGEDESIFKLSKRDSGLPLLKDAECYDYSNNYYE